MMEGIDILAVVPEGINLVANWPLAIIIGEIAWLGFGIWCGTETDSIIAGLFMGLMMASIILLVVAGVSAEPTEFIDTYKVTISDDIKLNEFYEQYEVIEQEGKIFTIKERQQDADNSLPSP